MRACRLTGSTKMYGVYSAVASAKAVPASPIAKAAPVTYNSIKVTWSTVYGATRYEVYRSTSITGTYIPLAATATISYTDIGVNTGTTYYYKVKAYRQIGSVKVYGNSSAIVSARTSLAVPTSVKALRASTKSITISWAAAAGATKYEVWRYTTAYAGTYSLLMTTENTFYTNTSLVTGKTNWYKVRAYRLVGSTKAYSSYSLVVYAKP